MSDILNLSLENEQELTSSEEVTPDDAEELEVYKRAKRFNALQLLSGGHIDSLEQFVKEHYGTYGLQRLKIGDFILKLFKYIPNNDLRLVLSCTKSASVVIATAGAGKTTALQLLILVDKLLDKALKIDKLKPMEIDGTTVKLSRILYLNYNRHNVEPITIRHKTMCASLNKAMKEADRVSDDIESSTVHAFCHHWLESFSAELNLPECKIMDKSTKEKIWNAIISPRWKKFYSEDEDSCITYEIMDELYVYKTESSMEWEEFFESSKFVDSGLIPEFVKACLKKYDSMKRQMGVYDFTDYLLVMLDVLRNHPEIKERIQSRYSLIIADENQDFSKLMNELILELYSPSNNKLVVVGDPDQVIYQFKGVSPDNIVWLSENLDNVELMGIDTNYRCPNVIVDAAKRILDLNILRFEKPIECVKSGGTIWTHPLALKEEQSISVISLLRKLGPDAWPHTVVTYRNNISSIVLAEDMYYAGIPMRTLEGSRPFTNRVFQQITRLLRALRDKDNFELNKELYRLLPISKNEWLKILEYNRSIRKNHLYDLEVPTELPRGFIDVFKVLFRVANIIDKAPVSDFIDSIIRFYRTYYFDFLLKSSTEIDDSNVQELYLERTLKFYKRPMTFATMCDELVRNNRDDYGGVVLSTFHGLKGLEFDYVIAVDFNDRIFPNYASIESKYSRNTAIVEKESENRLCYVLVTRAIKELHLFYQQLDPSYYLHILVPTSNSNEDKEVITLGQVSGESGESFSAKRNFIQRLIGGDNDCPF